jgi:hypothetical protein
VNSADNPKTAVVFLVSVIQSYCVVTSAVDSPNENDNVYSLALFIKIAVLLTPPL